jgi:hypothetical protein
VDHPIEGLLQLLDRHACLLDASVDALQWLGHGAQVERDSRFLRREKVLQYSNLHSGFRGRISDGHSVQVLLQSAIDIVLGIHCARLTFVL